MKEKIRRKKEMKKEEKTYKYVVVFFVNYFDSLHINKYSRFHNAEEHAGLYAGS